MATTHVNPFNKDRFDECMAYLLSKHGGSLTQYEMVKIHVMADVLHTLKYGRAIIGGGIAKWRNGPVVQEAYNRVRHWAYQWEADPAQQPEGFRIVAKEGTKFRFVAEGEAPSDRDFSSAERDTLCEAWNRVKSMKWGTSQDFFHDPNVSFLGKVWHEAGDEGSPIDWVKLIDAYASEHPDFRHADALKVLIST